MGDGTRMLRVPEKILMSEEKTNFTINGITEYGKKEDGEYGRVPKVFRTSFSHTKNESDAIKDAEEICKKLLANPVVHEYSISVAK